MIDTNLKPTHTLYIYNTDADKFGDGVAVGDANEVGCVLENTDGWENDNYADNTTGTITCQIWPDDAFYVSKGGKLHGLVAQFTRVGEPGDDDWYRIASVRPGESLVDGAADLVELTLARIAVPGQQAEES